jgi:thymidylate kinase
MAKLMIIRGLPGSGKSTLAQKVWEASCVYDERYEADMYFMKNDKYEFDATKLYNAHKWCFEKVYEDLHYDYNVIVSNTFTTMKELKQYLELMDVFPDLEITVVDMATQFESIHNVPQLTIDIMKDRWQPLDPSWVERGVIYTDSENLAIETM